MESPGQVQVSAEELRREIFTELYRAILPGAFDLVVKAIECTGEECLRYIEDAIRGIKRDIDYLVGRYGYEVMGNLTKVLQSALEFLAGQGLLNTDSKNMLSRFLIRDGDPATEVLRKVEDTVRFAGMLFMNAGCRAHYLGITKVGNYTIDRYLFLLGQAVGGLYLGDYDEAIRLLTAAALAFFGKDEEADGVLRPLGFTMRGVVRHLELCAFLERLYDLGVRFTEDDLRTGIEEEEAVEVL